MATPQLAMAWPSGNQSCFDDILRHASTDCSHGSILYSMFNQGRVSIGFSLLLLLVVPVRAVALRRSPRKTNPNYMYGLKIATTSVFASIKVAVLVLWSTNAAKTTPAIVSASISLAGASALCYLSYLEHSRSISPSSFLNLYLLVSLIPDLIQAKSLLFNNELHVTMLVYTAGIGVKLLLLFLEAQSKDAYLKPAYQNLSPEVTSGILSRAFMWWINPLLKTGYRKLLSCEDLPALDDNLSSARLCAKMKSAWDIRPNPAPKRPLLWAAWRFLKAPLLSAVFPRICLIVFRYSQPSLISYTIKYVSRAVIDTNRMDDEGYQIIAGAILIYTGLAASQTTRIDRATTMLRSGMIGLIHGRSLELTESSQGDLAAITLMSTDVDITCEKLSTLFEVWAQSVEVAVGFWLLAREIGWISVVPLFIIFACSRITPRVGKMLRAAQKVWTEAVQSRIAMTSSMLAHLKSIKMMGLSTKIQDNIQAQRMQEIALVKSYRWMIILLNATGQAVPVLVPAATFIVYAVQAKLRGLAPLSGSMAFTSLAIMTMVTRPTVSLLMIIPLIASAMASLERIESFLLGNPRVDMRQGTDRSSRLRELPLGTSQQVAVQAEDVLVDLREAISIHTPTISPSIDADPVLSDINLRLDTSTITIVAGPVGSGKSTLLKAILGETPFTGSISVSSDRIAYCASTPWLFNDTVRQNVLGLADAEDIDMLFYETVLHTCALDDDMAVLSDGDQTMIGSRGLNLSGGQKQRLALARALYSRLDVLLLDDVLSALDPNTERLVVKMLLGPDGLARKLGTTVVLATHATQHFHLADQIVILGNDGKIAQRGTYDSLKSQTGFISSILLKTGQQSAHSTEYGVSAQTTSAKISKGPSEDEIKDLNRKTGDLSVYQYWLSSVSWRTALAFVMSAASFSATLAFSRWWLKWWTEDSSGSVVKYATIYAAISIAGVALESLTLTWVVIVMGPKTAASLHTRLLTTVMRAPLSFFAETDSGVTLTRFSQDMTMIDRDLPVAAMNVVLQGFKILGQGVLLFSAEKMMLGTIPLCILVIFVLQRVYLETSRQIRILDLEAKSPVFSQFLETLEGLVTIRAFGWQPESAAANIKHLDYSTRPYYIMKCIQRWLGLVLNLLVTGLAVTVISLAVLFRGSTTGGQIGIALNVILVFNAILLTLVTTWTRMETSLGAIARLKILVETTISEDKPGEDFIPNESWPDKGSIEFLNVTASYSPDAIALHNVSFKILPGQKIGICGRTGSGKSSLLLTLLRLLDLDSGTILVDDLELQTIPRELIRSRMIAIPQDHFILSTSIRQNIDPSHSISDEQIKEALTKVDIWPFIESRGGLDQDMKSQPLSQGQQQLFCLARAMLRESKILILDEATSNVDMETDQKMQDIIRKHFQDHTVIMVAHRVETILDSDVVAVLDKGALAEFGSPQELLSRPSLFKDLSRR